jgi:hypothetical protein
MAFYFGYGSNMSTRYLSAVRNITPLRSQSSYLDDYALVMGLVGPNFIEPSFANIKPCTGARVEGVVHEITESDMARVIASEGENYEVIEAPIRFAGETVLAKTLRCKNEVNDDLPTSRRYMRILLKAARQNNLSADYIEALERKKTVYYPILSEIFAIRVYLWVKRRAKKQRV